MKRWIPILILALIVGMMFRYANQFGIPVIRMFATQGIVVIGFLAARALKTSQMEDGIRRVTEALEHLPESVEVVDTGYVGRHPIWLIQMGGRKILMGGSDLPQSASVKRAARTVLKQSEQLLNYGMNHGLIKPGEDSVRPTLVLLRRKLAQQATEVDMLDPRFSLTLVNPEGIGQMIEASS